MKIETHCHIEGSPDSLVSSLNLINVLKSKGYDGAIITDHNSYKGYDLAKEFSDESFTIFKGIEYDTSDAGHMLIILPNESSNIFNHKGMNVKDVIKIVHKLGGIIGPAHPFDYYKLGILNNTKWLKTLDIIKEFDFIEGFNSCGSMIGNHKASLVAKLYNKPIFAGSDSHRKESIGLAHTKLPKFAKDNNELIALVKRMEYGDTVTEGKYFTGTSKNKFGIIYSYAIRMFYGIRFVTNKISKRKAYKLALILGII